MKSILFATLFLVCLKNYAQVKPIQKPKKPAVQKIIVGSPVIKQPMVSPFQSAVTKQVLIKTTYGDISVALYDSTPLHRDNFVSLVNEKFYDSLLFHRIIQGFMIQGGDPLSRLAPRGTMLGMGGSDRPRIPAEIRPDLVHKKGTLCAARDGNPEKASSYCQFYIVQGQVYDKSIVEQLHLRTGFNYTEKQKQYYTTIGGTPMLDNNYTIFGEVVTGLDVVDRIITAAKDQNDRPLEDIRIISMTMLPDYVAPKPIEVKVVKQGAKTVPNNTNKKPVVKNKNS